MVGIFIFNSELLVQSSLMRSTVRKLLIENRRQPMANQQIAVKLLLVASQSRLREPMICFGIGKYLHQ